MVLCLFPLSLSLSLLLHRTARITFLQGILNWLGAIALGHILPSGESIDSRVMNQFIGLSLLLLMVVMLAFYNNHMNFYSNYAGMLSRWISVCWTNFVWTWPPRPSIVFSVPLLAKIVQVGYIAFCVDQKHETGNDNDNNEDNARAQKQTRDAVDVDGPIDTY